MKSVMISIQPKWCEKIAARWKTMELRKTKPNIPLPFKCYIYQTKFKWVFNLLRSLKLDDIADALTIGFGRVIGEFVCDHIMGHCEMANADLAEQQSFVRRGDIAKYSGGREVFGWHISNLVIYDKPVELSDFYKPCISPEFMYCPNCPVGGEYISESEYEALAMDGECSTEWYCNNRLRRPPQSWCYVEELQV